MDDPPRPAPPRMAPPSPRTLTAMVLLAWAVVAMAIALLAASGAVPRDIAVASMALTLVGDLLVLAVLVRTADRADR